MQRPVPCVRVIIRDSERRVLILKRSATEYGEGAWCLPGGKVDYGETVEQAARKEVFEETALECTTAEFLFYQDSPAPEPGKMHCINLYFECETRGDVVLNDESSEIAWIGPGELSRYNVVFLNDEGLQRYWSAQ